MKYDVTVYVELPRERMLELFDDPENLKKWMEGLEEFENLEGEPGQVGTRSRFLMRNGNRKMEIIETITVRNLPEELAGTYETQGMWNSVHNLFEPLGPHRTRWLQRTELRAEGMKMKLLMWFMPGAFKKQTLKYMEDFKKFAESEG